jgi:hypothetical protein
MYNITQYYFKITLSGLHDSYNHEFAHSELKDMAVHVYHFLFNDVLYNERKKILSGNKLPCQINQFMFDAVVFSSSGKSFDVLELYRWGRNQVAARRYGWQNETWNGNGPVPYIHKRRGGRHHYRRMATQSDRRLNQVIRDEGEPAIRASRNAFNLPNAWDDFKLYRERNWKSQHKGRKSWDKK